nr:hypothetical protein [Prevotella sp.]
FAMKRRKLKEIYDLLSSYVTSAEVKVVVRIGDKVKEASIGEDTFNALMAKLVEDEIANIENFVKEL